MGLWVGVYIYPQRLLVVIRAVDDIECAVTDAERGICAKDKDGGIVRHAIMLHPHIGLSSLLFCRVVNNACLEAVLNSLLFLGLVNFLAHVRVYPFRLIHS